ncbi:ribonuclease D [Brevibacterium sp. 5221]|uniref:Ribonuclease D n=1 Tax=Brevibacterium rongguiense TaxID=2695267 RepID=A0A6N9H9K7_9MICO|nr:MULTISPECIES: HRDC domain-containing protein [Brevibacterium]MYM20737.1 ribonuclease D [Brevibacterium rongguiense]WAL41043.1 HRDC domain-containing protein [Brevibacterium sp. BRM-1]
MSSNRVDESLPLLERPAGGVPPVIDTAEGMAAAAAALAAGTGAVGVDAERASGIRYGGRAFLIQLKRAGAGIVLLDPEALGDLSPIDAALRGTEWILHAATQDLPCLAEVGMRPDRLFDTELAARLLGTAHFGLASLVGEFLGVRLAKEHSNVDWSARPLPADWLAYAALDVELLDELRAALAQRLADEGKSEFARQEFEHLRGFRPAEHAEPWRRTHGLGALKSRRALGRVRAMWAVRDDLAEERDVAPSRIVADRMLIAYAQANLRSAADLQRMRGHRRPTPADARLLFHALAAADKLPDEQMPPRRAPDDRQPGGRVDREVVKDRLGRMKAAVAQVAAELGMAHDVLLTPRYVKALAAQPEVGDAEAVAAFLTAQGARPWQVEHTAAALAAAGA